MKIKTCIGTGLVALDILIDNKSYLNPKIFAGGSCGNVLSMLSFLNFESYPIARLADNTATDLIIEDLNKWGVNTTFIETEEKGSTPIIIHRILESKSKEPKHRFEFRNPNNGKWLPSFRPVLAKKVESINDRLPKIDVFYFDRVSRSSIELAKSAKEKGALIFFEPTSNRDKKQFAECLLIADIIKYSDERLKTYKEDYPNIQSILEIETSGKEGLLYRFKTDSWKKLNSFTVDNAIDTAGAGDWCTSGIIKTILDNGYKNINNASEDIIVESIRYGQALSAINCLYTGARGLMYQIDKTILDNMVGLIIKRKSISNLANFKKIELELNQEKQLKLDTILESF